MPRYWERGCGAPFSAQAPGKRERKGGDILVIILGQVDAGEEDWKEWTRTVFGSKIEESGCRGHVVPLLGSKPGGVVADLLLPVQQVEDGSCI